MNLRVFSPKICNLSWPLSTKEYSENSFLKNLKPTKNQWICIENQLSGFYFKLTLTGNEISITNHEVHRFSNSLQHKLKNPAKWLAKCIFAYVLRTRFCKHKVFGRITKATMVHHLIPKKAHINASSFFQNSYCWFISEHFGQTWLNPTTISRDIGKLLLQSSMSMPGMPDHTQEKLHAQTAAFMDILLHAKSKLSTSNIKI